MCTESIIHCHPPGIHCHILDLYWKNTE